jgi:hypothetical protein
MIVFGHLKKPLQNSLPFETKTCKQKLQYSEQIYDPGTNYIKEDQE